MNCHEWWWSRSQCSVVVVSIAAGKHLEMTMVAFSRLMLKVSLSRTSTAPNVYEETDAEVSSFSIDTLCERSIPWQLRFGSKSDVIRDVSERVRTGAVKLN